MNKLFDLELDEKYKSNLKLYNANSLDKNTLNQNSVDLIITSHRIMLA